MSGGMIPESDWTRVGKEFAEAQAAGAQQKILCAVCASRNNFEPPPAVVIVGGKSYCGAHYIESLDLPHA